MLILIIFFLLVNEWESLVKFFFGIIMLKFFIVCFVGIICWFKWCEFVVMVSNFWFFKIKWILVKIGWFLCIDIVKFVLLIIFVNKWIGNFIWFWVLIIGKCG